MQREEGIAHILKSVFGFDKLRLEQERIIHSILDGKDTLGVMPTGGGKSLCYQLPAYFLDGLCVVISPLISLMEDQVTNLDQFGIEAAFLNSSLDYHEKKAVEEKVRSGQIKILFVAPEGILNTNLLIFLREQDLKFIAIDEAHCVSQWGHEFRNDYTRLGELRSVFPNIPVLALTATADKNTRDDICRQLQLEDPNIFISGFDRPNIKYMVYERIDEISQLHKFIQDSHPKDTGIIYCLSRKKVEKVSEKLCQLGYNAVAYHAGMTTKQRTKAQTKFKTQDSIIVVATIAFGMGIDRPDVRFVAHLDLPKSIEGYYQETGRAGRDGKPASAWMVYGLSDVVKHSKMLELTEASEVYKSRARKKLDAMLALCEVASCRRKHLLSYFDEEQEENCDFCDACLDPVPVFDGSIAAQKLLSAIYRTGQSYGSTHVIDVLRGAKSQKIVSVGHDKLSVYGIGSDMSKNEWNSILRQLINKNYVFIRDYEYRSLALSKEARKVFTGEISVELHKVRSIKNSALKGKNSFSDTEREHSNPELFERLREYRKQLASEGKIPPYMIFSDRSLHDMCCLLPKDEESMLLVHGVGKSKFAKYGEGFIQIIEQSP